MRDDDVGEAQEEASKNPWITYGSPLQLARTFGMHDKLFDLLDEAPLLPSQTRLFCELILGVELPEPDLDAPAFVEAVKAAVATIPPVFDPVSGRVKPWIDVSLLSRHLNKQGVARCMGPSPSCIVA